ncbi:SGF29 tudor-like domain [Fragilaria crotonensis]|nr:SGF29 tudor-like domain [Fragilaria crotonensis]
MSRMNNSNNGKKLDGGLPQHHQGYATQLTGIQGYPPGMSMAPSPQTPTAQHQSHQIQQQQQHPPHLQHHERMMQHKMQQQQLEMQIKNQFSSVPMNSGQMMQQQQRPPQQIQQPPPQAQRQKSDDNSAFGGITGMPSPKLLARPQDLKNPPPRSLNPSPGTVLLSTNQPTPSNLRRDSSAPVTTPIVPSEEMKHLIDQLDWADRTIFLSRLLMGGASVNGFLRATATAQRIKKQRARQIKKQLLSPNEEEDLKKEAMNPRTAKRLRSELVSGLEFCRSLHETLRSVMKELNSSQFVVPLASPNPVATGAQSAAYVAPSANKPVPPAPVPAPPPKRASAPTPLSGSADQAITATSTTTASPGDPNGSSLRKLRKRKFPDVPTPNVSEIDPATSKKYSKKDYALVLLEVTRFRSLKEGDYVAAKPSSHHLWILARVMKDYTTDCGPPAEFLQLSETKRDALFKEKVVLKDIEDANSSTISVARSDVLPLPRTFAEAADWASRCRKGCRVYAMYPMTTALYSGTVIDNTTYCRGDDDIVVVEFDNEEADPLTGKMPHYHIPARFVTLIPREFPGASQNPKKRKSATSASIIPGSEVGKGGKRGSSNSVSVAKHKRGPSSDSALNDMLDEIDYGDINEELDLDQFELEFDMKKGNKI